MSEEGRNLKSGMKMVHNLKFTDLLSLMEVEVMKKEREIECRLTGTYISLSGEALPASNPMEQAKDPTIPTSGLPKLNRPVQARLEPNRSRNGPVPLKPLGVSRSAFRPASPSRVPRFSGSNGAVRPRAAGSPALPLPVGVGGGRRWPASKT
ncbi:hypothetical protein MA16_Dca021335 [Dendrobium catenatum]|uniref:Uncharacterized protein n=1 Tax=Dendrobium catenatum TaxID=906689 RepID=A0A2I0WWX2_9ASPA|nr:hypothetical protein MA16_Dca021335 [Dendrobium catenatum]